jgi:hypothetical protein
MRWVSAIFRVPVIQDEQRACVPQFASLLMAQIIVDRSEPSKSSATSELMIENVASKMPQRPTIIVLDSVTRFASFRPSPEVTRAAA